MASNLPWRKFYYKDFTADTQVLAVESCGAWIRILAFMNRCDDPPGIEILSLDGWARIIGVDVEKAREILTELEQKNVAEISGVCDTAQNDPKCHSHVTVMSRRLSREHKDRNHNRLRKQRERVSRKCHRHVTLLEQNQSQSQIKNREEVPQEVRKIDATKRNRKAAEEAASPPVPSAKKPRPREPFSDAFKKAFDEQFPDAYVCCQADFVQIARFQKTYPTVTPDDFVEMARFHWGQGEYTLARSLTIKGLATGWATLSAKRQSQMAAAPDPKDRLRKQDYANSVKANIAKFKQWIANDTDGKSSEIWKLRLSENLKKLAAFEATGEVPKE